MALYQLTLFYANLKSHAATMAQIRQEVESMAGTSWRVLSAGQQVCALGFVTQTPSNLIAERLSRHCAGENIDYLLVEVAAAPAGYLSKGVWQWLSTQMAAAAKAKAGGL